MRAVACAIVLAGCGRIEFDPQIAAHRIDILGSQLGGPVVDLPVLVRLHAPEVPVDRLAPSTLRFFAADRVTKLPYELDGDTPPELDAWVKVPSIDGDTTIWMTYGGAPVTDTGAETVWSSFLGVWHMDDGHDSTANHLDATFTNAPLGDGIVGAAHQFGSGYGEVPDNALFANLGPITWSAWVETTGTPMITSSILTRQHELTAADDFRLGPSGVLALDGQVNLDPGQVNVEFGSGRIVIGTWQLVSLTHDGAELKVGIDGVTVGMMAASGSIHTSAHPVWFGAGCNACSGVPSTDRFPGFIDEIRLEGVARDDVWLGAQRANVAGGLVVVHPAE
jgi:hypothetical protein